MFEEDKHSMHRPLYRLSHRLQSGCRFLNLDKKRHSVLHTWYGIGNPKPCNHLLALQTSSISGPEHAHAYTHKDRYHPWLLHQHKLSYLLPLSTLGQIGIRIDRHIVRLVVAWVLGHHEVQGSGDSTCIQTQMVFRLAFGKLSKAWWLNELTTTSTLR